MRKQKVVSGWGRILAVCLVVSVLARGGWMMSAGATEEAPGEVPGVTETAEGTGVPTHGNEGGDEGEDQLPKEQPGEGFAETPAEPTGEAEVEQGLSEGEEEDSSEGSAKGEEVEKEPSEVSTGASESRSEEAETAEDDSTLGTEKCQEDGQEAEDWGERVFDSSAWEELLHSGYWQQAWSKQVKTTRRAARVGAAQGTDELQIAYEGGENSRPEDGVTVSKTIAATELENVFDITLQVSTTSRLDRVLLDPDMAVVLVVDVSNTMAEKFKNTENPVTRYQAAMSAAEQFIDSFADVAGPRSQIGIVAFNTDATVIQGLSSCWSEGEAAELRKTLVQETGNIMSAEGYGTSTQRFTNLEGGIRCAADLLTSSAVTNQNKFIVLLTDGFPTTYVDKDSTKYEGYNPYCEEGTPGMPGVFYDKVNERYCTGGTSYSDEAALRAAAAAQEAKDAGLEIFTIGVDIGGQTIAQYEKLIETVGAYVIDRTGENYAIGSADDPDSYMAWLRDAIGSKHYENSDNAEGLANAFATIFQEIQSAASSETRTAWITKDPMPAINGSRYLEFIGFFDCEKELTEEDLSGAGENEAKFDPGAQEIAWDLKKSKVETQEVNGEARYQYELTYRVRLKNEETGFAESTEYLTNGVTTLTYRVAAVENGQTILSEEQSLDFPVPKVKGFLAELAFSKVDQHGEAVEGAEFTLRHDTERCEACRGDEESAVALHEYTATSGGDGGVKFEKIPSGHCYTLEETRVPGGYEKDETVGYLVTVAYGKLSITQINEDQTETEVTPKEFTVTNLRQGVLPKTGGGGAWPFWVLGGSCAGGGWLLRRRKCGSDKF